MSAQFNFQFSEDKQTMTMNLFPESGAEGEINLSFDQVGRLIQVLGLAHWAMAEGKHLPELNGVSIKPALQMKWAIQAEPVSEGAFMAFQHPGFGSLGFVITASDVKLMIKALQGTQKQTARNKKKR